MVVAERVGESYRFSPDPLINSFARDIAGGAVDCKLKYH